MTAHTRIALGALLLGLTVTIPAWAQSSAAQTSRGVVPPATPAGRVLTEWLEAFNSGDSARLGAYYRKYSLQRPVEAMMQFRNQTGGFTLVSVERSDPRLIEFVLREKNTGADAMGVIELEPANDLRQRQSALRGIPPGASPAAFRIDAATRARVIDSAIARLRDNYVFPEVATRMADAVRARHQRGEYDDINNGMTFAGRLTDDFRAVSKDRHLGVQFFPNPLPVRRPGRPDSAAIERNRRETLSDNCGFVRVERMPGNVGYLKFNYFGEPDLCGPVASAAMNFVANVDALIVDLRDNGGGDPAMVAYVSSYLFPRRTHLNDIYERPTNRTEQFFTRDDVPGRKLRDGVPVYVLTSSRTFSGAEEFSYNLKNLKRATIVGETTGGGAHPVDSHRIDAHFSIGVPFARAINPISKTNWEGSGVAPDVAVSAGDALTTAQRLISEKRPTP